MTKQFYLGCARFSSKTIILFHVILRINYRHGAALQTVLISLSCLEHAQSQPYYRRYASMTQVMVSKHLKHSGS